MSDIRPALQSALDAFGLPATVTVPDGAPVTTTAFWLPSVTVSVPVGAEYQREEQKRRIALPLAGLDAMPRGTVVVVAEYLGATPTSWRVDEAERIDFDHYRATVVPNV